MSTVIDSLVPPATRRPVPVLLNLEIRHRPQRKDLKDTLISFLQGFNYINYLADAFQEVGEQGGKQSLAIELEASQEHS